MFEFLFEHAGKIALGLFFLEIAINVGALIAWIFVAVPPVVGIVIAVIGALSILFGILHLVKEYCDNTCNDLEAQKSKAIEKKEAKSNYDKLQCKINQDLQFIVEKVGGFSSEFHSHVENDRKKSKATTISSSEPKKQQVDTDSKIKKAETEKNLNNTQDSNFSNPQTESEVSSAIDKICADVAALEERIGAFRKKFDEIKVKYTTTKERIRAFRKEIGEMKGKSTTTHEQIEVAYAELNKEITELEKENEAITELEKENEAILREKNNIEREKETFYQRASARFPRFKVYLDNKKESVETEEILNTLWNLILSYPVKKVNTSSTTEEIKGAYEELERHHQKTLDVAADLFAKLDSISNYSLSKNRRQRQRTVDLALVLLPKIDSILSCIINEASAHKEAAFESTSVTSSNSHTYFKSIKFSMDKNNVDDLELALNQ